MTKQKYRDEHLEAYALGPVLPANHEPLPRITRRPVIIEFGEVIEFCPWSGTVSNRYRIEEAMKEAA